MTDKYTLAYQSIDELNTVTGQPASGDFRIEYDDSARKFVKRDATTGPGNATVAEIDRVADLSARVVNTTVDLTLTTASHSDKIVTVDKADGAAITLPAASGSGSRFTVAITTAITSNSTTIKAANASDAFVGSARGVDDDAEGATGYQWNAETGDDTVTLDGAATGGKIGDYFILTDIAANVFLVEGCITQSGGSEATPFSATVS